MAQLPPQRTEAGLFASVNVSHRNGHSCKIAWSTFQGNTDRLIVGGSDRKGSFFTLFLTFHAFFPRFALSPLAD